MIRKTCRFDLFAFFSMMFLGVNSFSIISNILLRKTYTGPGLAASGCALRHIHSGIGDSLTMRSDAAKPASKKNGDARLRSGAVRNSKITSNKVVEGGGKMSSEENSGVRLNKCLHELSRRGADDAIAEGRVTINNQPATNGMRVQKRDIVRLVRIITDDSHIKDTTYASGCDRKVALKLLLIFMLRVFSIKEINHCLHMTGW